MQIAAIHSLPPIASTTQPVQPASSVANRSAATASPAPNPASPPAVTSPSATSSGAATSHASAPPPVTSSSSAAEASLAAVYTTTVHGTTYSGGVEESDGEYTVSIVNLPGATASGSSVQAAEDSLGTIIDTLV